MEEAERIARRLVENRLAACVNIVPGVTSVYRWEGSIEKGSEWLLLIKTRRELFDRLEAELKTLHSYAVPEIVALTVVEGSAQYLDWIAHETEELEESPKSSSTK